MDSYTVYTGEELLKCPSSVASIGSQRPFEMDPQLEAILKMNVEKVTEEEYSTFSAIRRELVGQIEEYSNGQDVKLKLDKFEKKYSKVKDARNAQLAKIKHVYVTSSFENKCTYCGKVYIKDWTFEKHLVSKHAKNLDSVYVPRDRLELIQSGLVDANNRDGVLRCMHGAAAAPPAPTVMQIANDAETEFAVQAIVDLNQVDGGHLCMPELTEFAVTEPMVDSDMVNKWVEYLDGDIYGNNTLQMHTAETMQITAMPTTAPVVSTITSAPPAKKRKAEPAQPKAPRKPKQPKLEKPKVEKPKVEKPKVEKPPKAPVKPRAPKKPKKQEEEEEDDRQPKTLAQERASLRQQIKEVNYKTKTDSLMNLAGLTLKTLAPKELSVDYTEYLQEYNAMVEAKNKRPAKKLKNFAQFKSFADKATASMMKPEDKENEYTRLSKKDFGKLFVLLFSEKQYEHKLKVSSDFLENLNLFLINFLTRIAANMLVVAKLGKKNLSSNCDLAILEQIEANYGNSNCTDSVEESIYQKKTHLPTVERIHKCIFHSVFMALPHKPTTLGELVDMMNAKDRHIMDLYNSKITQNGFDCLRLVVYRFMCHLVNNVHDRVQRDNYDLSKHPLTWNYYKLTVFDPKFYEFASCVIHTLHLADDKQSNKRKSGEAEKTEDEEVEMEEPARKKTKVMEAAEPRRKKIIKSKEFVSSEDETDKSDSGVEEEEDEGDNDEDGCTDNSDSE